MKLYIWRSLFHCPKLVFATVFFVAISWCGPATVQSKNSSSYGLGIVQNRYYERGTVRCGNLGNLVAVDLLAPDDGARTLTARPTFYWYIDHKSQNEIKNEKSFYIDFILREGFGLNAKSIFRSRSVGILKASSGLYRFTLPPNSPALEIGKTYAWHIRYVQADSEYEALNSSNQIDTRAIVKRESNSSVIEQVRVASTNLEKARIFAENLYWYDALDEYTKWIDANPHDKQASHERLLMLDQIIERNPKLKCIDKYKVNNSSLINSKQSTPQIMKLQSP
ncbi:hypothetical protein APA_5162 [Pseudanabaena sp. lw0831]|uniref:DUF928 domain-containing protein n=1 Tax=Pseudanabaena sp. lw0831 TaxID=1357935 RepID=UPI001915951D|nr:DUF928 domain-containing protein [Pseudanabaena sp. lw0831]GBO56827.1 hypothetical protein APA_5162 [Pseudanabaena sp. lw0831]